MTNSADATPAEPSTTSPSPAEDPPPADTSEIFDLEPHGKDVWVGESPAFPWGRIYGGLTIAQSLWSATQTVIDTHTLHSMHAYFILGGNPSEPVRYEVDRVRNGRSFSTRRVVARQSGGAIFTLECSFQRYEEGVETQTATFPSHVGPPSEYPAAVEGSGIERSHVPQLEGHPLSESWVRFDSPLPDDPRVHACALGYLSDSNAMSAVAASHPLGRLEREEWAATYMAASLDHAMWFHRPLKANDWLLISMEGQGMLRTRGLAIGNVFSVDGEHVATIAQEGLLRVRKN